LRSSADAAYSHGVSDLRELIRSSPAYRLLKPEQAARRRRIRELTREFVQPGSLVFDVGANRGEYSRLYTRLGARVVAVEPNPELAPLIKEVAPEAVVVTAAAGAEAGEADLWVGAGEGDSTLATDYRRILERDLHLSMRPVRVRVVTLDQLAAEHGDPDFVKIDVEGYEPEVLRGMSFRPPALSLEFHRSMLDRLARSLSVLEGYRFRVSLGNSFEWATGWLDEAALLAYAESLTDEKLFADVYATRP